MKAWPLKHVVSRIAIAREAARNEHRNSDSRSKRWLVHETPLIWAIKNGDRLNGCSFHGWKGKLGDIEALLAEYPDAEEVVIQGAIFASENKEAHDAFEYDRFEWAARVWAPGSCPEDLWPKHTPWVDAKMALTTTGDSYRPSMDMSDPVMQLLADDYDSVAAILGDERRAYRYGEPKTEVANGQKGRVE